MPEASSLHRPDPLGSTFARHSAIIRPWIAEPSQAHVTVGRAVVRSGARAAAYWGYRAEDLTFDVYELRYDQVKALNELLSNRGINGDWLPVNESTFSGADAALLGLMVPGQIVMLPFTIIDLVMDPPGAGIKKIPKPRRLVFAYDADGNFRWQGCCFPTDFIDENGPSVMRLPDPASSANWKENPPDAYWADYQVLTCHNAKADDSYSQNALFNRFNKTVPDPIWTYYWARVASEASIERKIYLLWAENSLPRKVLKAGEAYFLSHPLETVNCREVANMLVEGESSGSEGPNVGP